MPPVLISPTRKTKMGFLYWNEQILEDDMEEDYQLGAKASDPKVELDKLGKKHPLILDVKLPFRKTLSIPYYIGFLNVNMSLGWYDTDTVSTPYGTFCRTPPLVNFPIESFRPWRRTRSVCDMGDLFVEYASSSSQAGNILVSPSQCTFDSVDRSLTARSLVKSSLFLQVGTLDGTATPVRATSFVTSPMKTFGIISSPFRARNALSLDPGSHITDPRSQISNLKASENLLVSCSSTNSTSSHHSNSSTSVTVSKGIIYCALKNGSLSFLFKDCDDSGKVYAASMNKIQSSFDEALDYLYFFRSMTGNKASEFIGKMKVFSSLILNPNRSKLVETEFVLYGVEDNSKEVQVPTSTARKIKGLSKKVAKIFKSNHSSNYKATSISKINEPKFQLVNSLQDFDERESVNHMENGFQPSLEQAAIVIQSSPHCSEEEEEIGGWGLKFLRKVNSDFADTSVENCEASDMRDDGASWVSVNVLIPTGFHGGPSKGDGAPSPLTERWRSGGHCDCGGWDIGCPLTILHDKGLTMPKAFANNDSQENCTTIDLFLEGEKHVEPSFKMVATSEGVYTVYFQSTLLSLQAFSMGVAIIHSRTPDLYLKL